MKERKDLRDKAKKERASKRKTIEANAERYFKEHQASQQKLIDDKRKAKAAGNFFVEPEAKIAIAIRTRG